MEGETKPSAASGVFCKRLPGHIVSGRIGRSLGPSSDAFSSPLGSWAGDVSGHLGLQNTRQISSPSRAGAGCGADPWKDSFVKGMPEH